MAEEFEQKKEFLQREEIKTMQKDIAKLREAEAQKERERVANLKLGEKIAIKKPIEQETPLASARVTEEKPAIAALIPKSPPKKSGSFKKILTRIAIVFACFLVFSSLAWFFIIRKPLPEPRPEPLPKPLPEQVINQEPVGPKPEPQIEEPPAPLHIIERIVGWGHFTPKIPRIIDTIIIHSVYNALGENVHNIERVIQQYKTYRVTGHYLIARDGAVYRLAPNKAIAYHAGVGRMPDNSRVNVINNFSIGIGLIYTREESPTEKQYQSLVNLVKELREKYNIPFENILGHKVIAPDRETGPWNFDWKKFNQMIK